MRIGFIGLGAMGMPMAINVAKAGHTLAVWNRSKKDLKGFGSDRPALAASPAEAAQGADAVVTMLSDDAAVEQVVDNGLLEALKPQTVHVVTSTISIAAARRLADAHAQRGIAYVAAPVFGRPDIAAAKKLWVVAAGPSEARAKVRPLLEAIGRGISEFGDEPWRANLVKLANNFLIASLIETPGEAYALVRKGGVAPKDFLEAANNLFQSPFYANYGTQIAEARYEPAMFFARHGLKDTRLALAAADELEVPMPLAGLAHDGMLAAVAHGLGDADWTIVARLAQDRANLH